MSTNNMEGEGGQGKHFEMLMNINMNYSNLPD